MNWNIAPFTYTQSKAGKGVDGRMFEVGKLDEVKNQYWDRSYQYGAPDEKGTLGDREKTKAADKYNRSCGEQRTSLLSTSLYCAIPTCC